MGSMTDETLSFDEVADQLRARITGGELARGALVPSQSQLMAQYGVGPSTARTALQRLTAEGLITSGAGKPRRVRDRRVLYHYASKSEAMARREDAPADAWMTDVREQGFEPGYLTPRHRVELIEADENVARLLELEPRSLVVVRRRVRTVDGRPDNINDTFYDHGLALQFPEILSPADVPQGIVALMASRGYKQVRYRHELHWRPPTPDEAQALELPADGVSVLVQYNTGYTAERPVKVTITTWPGDSHALIYDLQA
jgi:GntR family transcriptional regulator